MKINILDIGLFMEGNIEMMDMIVSGTVIFGIYIIMVLIRKLINCFKV